jgi:hypothetical protein
LYLQAVCLLFNFLAVSTFLSTWPCRECICVGVLPSLVMFGYKTVLLEMMMDPAISLSFQVLETKQPCQGGVVSVLVELLSIEVFVEVFQCLHNSQ